MSLQMVSFEMPFWPQDNLQLKFQFKNVRMKFYYSPWVILDHIEGYTEWDILFV